MSKTIRKIITGTLAAMSTMSIATPVMASTVNIDDLYEYAYSAMRKAQETESQADINAAMELIWQLRNVGDENNDSNLINAACTWSSLVDQVQHPKLVKIVDAITKAQETCKQEDINAAFATIEPELPAVWRSSYTSAIDLVQQKLQNKLVAAVERAEAIRTEESVKAARELVSELLTSTDNAIINWVRVYEGRLNIIVGDGSADDDYLIDGDNNHKPGHGDNNHKPDHGDHVDINKPVTPDTLGPEGGVMPTLPGGDDIINQPVTPDTLGPEGGVMPTLPGNGGNNHNPGHGNHVNINKPVTPDTLGPEGGVMPTLPGGDDIINQPVTPDTLGPEGGVMPTLPGGNGGVSVDDPNIDPGFTVEDTVPNLGPIGGVMPTLPGGNEGVSVDDPNIDPEFTVDGNGGVSVDDPNIDPGFTVEDTVPNLGPEGGVMPTLP